MGVFSKDVNALELLAVLKVAPEVLTTKCAVLLLACVRGTASSSTEKKFAFEAVMGVLGVFDTT
jgi:hypothetical protein